MEATAEQPGSRRAAEEAARPKAGDVRGGGEAERLSAARAWSGLGNPGSSAEFYASWLALLCGGIPGTAVGLLLIRGADGTFVPASIWPEATADPSHLSAAAEQALVERTSVLVPGEREPKGTSARVHLAHPITAAGNLLGVVVIDLIASQESQWRTALEQLAWAAGWPEALFWRQKAEEGRADEKQLPLVVDVLRAADQHDRFEVAAVLVANRLADRLACDRVTVGLIGRRGIALRAISHSATFDRKSELVVGLEAAMQEAFDQHDRVAFPPVDSTRRRISVAHAEFVEKWKRGAMASLLLIAAGRPFGVLALERPAGQVFAERELEIARAVAEAVGPLLDLKHRQSRLITGRLFQVMAEGLASMFGAERLALKLGSLSVAAILGVLALWPADFRVSARAVLEGSVQRAAVAPFDGFVAQAPLRAGDIVREGQEIAVLEDRDLLLEKLKWETERRKLVQRQREALAKHERTDLLVFGTQIEQAQSQLDLTLEMLKRARVTSPIDGIIVSGDLTQMLGAPVTQGKVLFEIAPLSSYRLILQVDERDIGLIDTGMQGTLLLTGAATRAIEIQVVKLTSVSMAEDGHNFFRVEASLTEAGEALRPGMEGVAKIKVGERSLLWIWMRPVVDRLRMFLWNWTP